MPGIADTLKAGPSKGGTPPLIPTHLDAMPDDLRKLAEKLVASPTHSDRQVADAFTSEGYPTSQGAVRNYRQSKRIGRYAQSS